MGDWVRIGEQGASLQKEVGDYMATILQSGGMTLAELRRKGSSRITATVRFASPEVAKSESEHLLLTLAGDSPI